MNIAIDVSPLQTGHRVRGTGFYLHHLKKALEDEGSHQYYFFSDHNKLPSSVDLIHYPYFDPFFLTLPMFKKFKTVVTVHDLTPLVFPDDFPPGMKGSVKWQIQKYALKNVDTIITDSSASKKDIEKFGGIKQEKISVVYLAAGEQFQRYDKEKTKELLKKYDLTEKFVLYVGDATANKNLPRLIQAVSNIGVPLVMVGKTLSEGVKQTDNPWNRSLVEAKSLIAKNDLIRIVGFVSDEELVAFYNAATVFVMPSLYEGFGLPVLEAMACGCPVITSKEGSLSEIVEDSAYIVDAYDSLSIEKGIKNVFNDTHLQEKLSEKGLLQAKKFSWKKCAQETIEVYEKVFQSK